MELARGSSPTSGLPAAIGHESYFDAPMDSGPSPIARIWGIIRKRKWVLVAAIAIALVVGMLTTLLMTPEYTASATIEIQRETRNFTNVAGAETEKNDSTVDQEFYQTQYGLLRSRSLADRVAQQLNLSDNADFITKFGSRRTRKWFVDGKLVPNASTRAERAREAGDILLKELKVVPERDSRLVTIAFTSPDAAFSKRVVDAWSANFIKITLERRYEMTSYARKFLEDRLSQLRNRIDETERKVVDYASKEGIINVPDSASGDGTTASRGERLLVGDDLATLNRELSRATADRIQAESRLGAQGGNVTESLQDQGVSQIRSQRAELAAEYAKLVKTFTPSYPPAQALNNQIAQLDKSIASEESRVRSTLRQTYLASIKRENDLLARVAQLKTGYLDLQRRAIKYNIYQRDADTNRQLYDALLQRYKEIGVAGGVGVNNISIVDPAEQPHKPSSPKLLVNMAIALLAGLLVGAGIVFVLEQIDEGVSDPAEVAANLDIPLLGTVPKTEDENVSQVLIDPKEPISEAYFSLQTNLSFTTDHGFPKTIAIISSKPAEGKSLTAFALAMSLSRSGRNVLLIDGDMRSPSVHQLLQIRNRTGLSNYLAGEENLDELISATKISGLSVMTAGPQPPNAAEMLSTGRLDKLLAELKLRFDNVVIDSPPVMGIADAPLIGSKVEGVLFVIEAHATKKSVARVAVSRLLAARVRVIGAVLTKFDLKRAHYGYGYDYGYGYGYGTPGIAGPEA